MPARSFALQEGERYLCDVSSRRCSRTPHWTNLDFSDSDTDSDDNHCKRCFRVRRGSLLRSPRMPWGTEA